MIDNFNRKINYLRVSVTDLCNLRCRYCMPEEGVVHRDHSEMMTAEETLAAINAAVELGINKIRITGGEPLVKRGIVKLCKAVADMPGVEEVCITTNGILLTKYAAELKEAGVDRLNISLDTLDPDKFTYITRVGNLQDVLDGIDAAEKAGFENTKINCVLMGGFNDDEIEAFVDMTREKPIEVRFIELMPIGGGIDFDKQQFVSCEEVLKRVPELEPLETEDGVARLYKIPGAPGRVGLIRPISCEFCEGCNKIRLTADGKIKPCLHSAQEVPIKGFAGDEMKAALERAILEKPERRGDLDAENPSEAGRDMNQIGG